MIKSHLWLFLILNKNPLDLDTELLNTLKIEKMLLGGKDYKKVDQNFK